MIPILDLSKPQDRSRVESLLGELRLDPADLALNRGDRAKQAAAIQEILADVAKRGDEAIVVSARMFDKSDFSLGEIRVSATEMANAVKRVPAAQLAAIRRAIAQ